MNCPFELPAEKYEPMKIIRDKERNFICGYEDDEDADYILQAINSHEKRYREGYEDGLRAYAWWKDGIEYVGSCGTTLKQALREAEKL